MICGISSIPQFYEHRHFKPAWAADDMKFTMADELVAAIIESDQHGLLPENYHLERISELLSHVRKNPSPIQSDPMLGVDLDILLTDAFLLYASHLVSGRVNPETIHAEWEATSPKVDLSKILEGALNSNSVGEALKQLAPPYPGYEKLKLVLIQYRNLVKTKEWPTLADGPALRLWDLDPRIPLLKKRLEMPETTKNPLDANRYEYSPDVEKAVKVFQSRHGLSVDGIFGPKTLSAINVPISQRVRQLEINLERWRWISRDLEKKYIIINIADFKLNVMESLSSVLDMRVVAGKAYRKTPVFSDKIKYLVLNPYWNVPTKIAVQDLLPDICKDINTIYQKNITVFENWGEDAAILDPKTIPWCQLNRTNFRYKLRQNPGPQNALGRLKFIFPNKYAVYLHDTPQKNLFQRTFRGFSSGCIRLEKPIELALYLLKDDPNWPEEVFMAQLESGERKTIGLKKPIPIHILYWTAWVDENGEIQFREDIYERDKAIDIALKERAPRNDAIQ